MKRYLFVFIPLLLMLPSAFTWSDDVSKNPASDSLSAQVVPSYVLKFDRLGIDDMRLEDTLSLILESQAGQVAGFDLKFGCDSRYFSIVEVLQGEIPDSCRWEFFRATPLRTDRGESRPSELWKVTALAKMSADTTSPPCLDLGRPASLLKLVLSNEGVREVPDHAAPIFFVWEDCRDNVLSSADGRSMVVSDSVVNYYDLELSSSESEFPTYSGTPESCIDPRRANRPQRLIQFYNGGVEFKLDLGEDQDSADKSSQ